MSDTPPTINLDAMRAAAAEQDGHAPELIFGARTFNLPVKLPARFAMALASVDLERALGALFGDQAEAFWSLQPTLDDVENLIEAVARQYGLGNAGKSAASGA